MSSAASSDVTVLSVKLAKPRQEGTRKLRQDTEVAFELKMRDLAVQRLAFAEKQWQKAVEKGDKEGAKEWEKKVEKAEEKLKEAKMEVKVAKKEAKAEDLAWKRQAPLSLCDVLDSGPLPFGDASGLSRWERSPAGAKREDNAQHACAAKREEAEPVRPSKRQHVAPPSQQEICEASQEGLHASASSNSRASRAEDLERQSWVQNISWNGLGRWQLCVQEGGKSRQIYFPISKHMKEGLSEDEAAAAALEAAKAHREELVRQGKLHPPRRITGKVIPASPRTKKRERGGAFKTLAEAEAKARELAKKLGLHDPVRLSELRRAPALRAGSGRRRA